MFFTLTGISFEFLIFEGINHLNAKDVYIRPR